MTGSVNGRFAYAFLAAGGTGGAVGGLLLLAVGAGFGIGTGIRGAAINWLSAAIVGFEPESLATVLCPLIARGCRARRGRALSLAGRRGRRRRAAGHRDRYLWARDECTLAQRTCEIHFVEGGPSCWVSHVGLASNSVHR